MEKRPWLPIAVALVVSSASGAALYSSIGFLAGFTLATVLQLIVGGSVNKWMEVRTALQMENELTQRIADAAKQSLQLQCPCTTQARQVVPLRFDQQNFYKCINCSKNIGVDLSVKTALVTEIIDLETTHNQLVAAMAEVTE